MYCVLCDDARWLSQLWKIVVSFQRLMNCVNSNSAKVVYERDVEYFCYFLCSIISPLELSQEGRPK